MKNTIIFFAVAVSAVLTWFGYALFASLITDSSFNKCLTDETVMSFLLFSGWILPSLVGLDLYRSLNRNENRREKMIQREIREIKTNTYKAGRKTTHSSLQTQYQWN